MERKSNVTVWQLRLFEGFDKDVMVMQRDEEEVFENALHVFFDKEYYDAYVTKAKKYSEHRYAYHEDKLGEVIYQIFDEKIDGLVIHAALVDQGAMKNSLCEDKYLSVHDLKIYEDAVYSYHFLYTAAIERMSKEEAVANLWNKNVFIIGQLPDFSKAPAKQQTFELMTLRRKKDGSVATAEDFDYESLKVFLTPESAMRFNPDKKPVNRYRLSMLANIVKKRLQIIIEPHRNYYLEFDPATIDISEYYHQPVWDEAKVRKRIQEYAKLDEVYMILAATHSDYRTCLGTPMLVKMNEQNVMMYLFEKYDDAVRYAIMNPQVAPVFDGVYPIGTIKKSDKLQNLHVLLAISNVMGVNNVNLDMETEKSLGCSIPFFLEAAGFETDLKKVLSFEDYNLLVSEKEGKPVFRLPVIPFTQQDNPYMISEKRREELKGIFTYQADRIVSYATKCSLPEMMFILNQAGISFDEARKAGNEEKKKNLNKTMNMMTIPIVDAMLERPFIYTLRNDDGTFSLKNDFSYLLITNRFENGRGGVGKLTPASIDNENFMEKLEEASKIAVLTDGPNLLCLLDIHLMSEVIKQRKRNESLMAEMMIYLTQGLNMSYEEALVSYNQIKLDNDIFVEFISTVRNGQYPPMGMLHYDGRNAKMLAEEKNLNPLEAYLALLDCKFNIKQSTQKAPEKKEMYQEVTESATESATNGTEKKSGEKKSLFGKLFTKRND